MADKRTYADRREELIRAVAKRRRKIKQLAITYKGGQCQVCGYQKYPGALDLHHLNHEMKEFGIADKGVTRSWEKVKVELDKCVLVCANCHREIEAGITQPPEVIRVEIRGEIGEPHPRKRGTPSQVRHRRKGVETIPKGSTPTRIRSEEAPRPRDRKSDFTG